VSVSGATVTEGNSGTRTATVTVTLSAAATSSTTVNWATADGTAKAGSDYVGASGTLTFAPGETTKTISISVNGDSTYETDEAFTVNLSNPSGATLGTATGTVTITNDDAMPTVSIGSLAVLEGNRGSQSVAIPISLSAPSSVDVTVVVKISGGSATAGSDYAAWTSSQTVTIAAGTTSASVVVVVYGDRTVEANETVLLTLSSPTGATIATGTGTLTITNDD